MASTYWIKLYHEMLHDPKVMRLPDRLFRRWIEVLLLAGEGNREGVLPSVDDMAWTLRQTPEDMSADLVGLGEAGLIQQVGREWIVTRFAVRQAAVPGKERTERYRVRQHKAEALCDEPVTKRYTESDTETETETDVDMGAQCAQPEPEVVPFMEPPEPEPEPKRASRADPRTKHPAVALVKGITGRNPNKAMYDSIIQAIGDHPRGEDAAGCYREWIKRGYNPNALTWLIDWYPNGIPRNGQGPRGSPSQGMAGVDAAIEQYLREEGVGGDSGDGRANLEDVDAGVPGPRGQAPGGRRGSRDDASLSAHP